jgi:hypothetical protein
MNLMVAMSTPPDAGRSKYGGAGPERRAAPAGAGLVAGTPMADAEPEAGGTFGLATS